MANKRNLLIVAVALALTVALAVLLSVPRVVKAPPIAFRFVADGKFHNGGNIWFGRTFWVTNHTSKAVVITITAVEIKDGSNWIVQPIRLQYSSQTLQFRSSQQQQATGSGPSLGSHHAGLADLDISVPSMSQPSGTTWRASANVQEELTGVQRIWAAIRIYVQGRRRAPNPFSSTITYWAEPTKVVSKEFVEP